MSVEFSDEELIAHLDGFASDDLSARISEQAVTDVKLHARIAGLELDSKALQTAFDPMLGVARSRNLGHKLECAVSHQAANSTETPTGLIRFASYAAALAIGAGLSWTFFMPADDWRAEVAHYQALYVVETLSPVAPDAARLQAEFTRASDALGLQLDPAAFADVQGLELRRAQVLGFKGTALVQIAFTQPDGTPVAFCILRDAGGTTSPQADTLVGLAAASWESPTHRFLAIGGTDRSVILDLASRLKQRL